MFQNYRINFINYKDANLDFLYFAMISESLNQQE